MSNLEVFVPDDNEKPRDERKEIECATREQHFDDGSIISGHVYKTTEEYDNCHVVIDRCTNCGHVSVGWWHMDIPPIKHSEVKP